MHLDGIHHITAITADAQRNVDFYVRVLGLRLVKKTVNFDAPDFYHLYYGDERGAPGSIMTFFEFPNAPAGSPGAGMVHRIIWRVADADALEYWAGRLSAEGVATEEQPSALLFSDPEGLGLELVVDESHDPALIASGAGIPDEHALLGLAGVRAYTADQDASHYLLTGALRFTALADNAGYLVRGGAREAIYHYDPAPAEGNEGAGTVHHVAWASQDSELSTWRQRAIDEGMKPTDIIDRQYFQSIYFREPSGVLFEVATLSPGFAVDEPPDRLGETLRLPPQHEPLRPQLEQKLTPITNPRTTTAGR